MRGGGAYAGKKVEEPKARNAISWVLNETECRQDVTWPCPRT